MQLTGDETIGLYFYNARFYDPALGRFVQADSIVPSPGDPQSLNRYSYVLNSPLVYVDPSGHCPKDDQACWAKLNEIQQRYQNIHITPSDLWNENDLGWVMQALDMMLATLGGSMDWFQNTLGNVTYDRWAWFLGADGANNPLLWPDHVVLTNDAFSTGEDWAVTTVIHETGHVIDHQGSVGGTFTLSFHTGSRCSSGSFAGKCFLPHTFKPGGDTVSDYAATEPVEEFAETFTALVVVESNYPSAFYNTIGADQTYKMSVVMDFLQGFKPDPALQAFWEQYGYPAIFTPSPLN